MITRLALRLPGAPTGLNATDSPSRILVGLWPSIAKMRLRPARYDILLLRDPCPGPLCRSTRLLLVVRQTVVLSFVARSGAHLAQLFVVHLIHGQVESLTAVDTLVSSPWSFIRIRHWFLSILNDYFQI